jgi:parallel beta-helix repeat protein
VLFRLKPLLEIMEDRTLLSAFLVTNCQDDGPGSLRQAILASDSVPGGATIDFAIPGHGVQAIRTASPLPTISGSVLVDGTSQPGYTGTPLIEIDGEAAGAGNGLTITGSGSTIRGLAIDGFASGAAILIEGPEASHNAIYGNQLGTNSADPLAPGNLHGVEVSNGAHDNDVGSNSPGGANAIGGNIGTGVLLSGASIDGSQGFGVAAADLSLNGSATLQGGRLQLTDSAAQFTGSAFTLQPIDVRRFQAQFDFGLAGPGNGGVTFTIERQGPTALGGEFGYEGISQSVTVLFNFASTYFPGFTGANSIGVALNGGAAYSTGSISLANTGIELTSGDEFHASMSYDGRGLSVTITDLATGAAVTDVFSVDIPGTIGDTAGFVGFTGETYSASQSHAAVSNVLDWSFTSSALVAGNRVAGNTIAGNGGAGVAVVGAVSTGNSISGNTIFGNAGPAIDKSGDGPNGIPQSPAIITTAEGGRGGWLASGTPDAVYHIDVFASANYAADGSGEAQDFLGSLDVTTDGEGRAVFDVPFTPPADLPIVTATVTDPLGNTSEVSGLRTASIVAPVEGIRISPGQALTFSAGSATGLALQDPEAGPLVATWRLTISVPVGTLSFQQRTGAGLENLQVQGTLTLINEVLAHLVFTPPPGFYGNTTVSMTAESAGAVPIHTTINITDGFFVVKNVADLGPGSLRQAILDSDAAGGSNTIAFALPGDGIHTIALASPLPQATTPILIDGSTQPGFAGGPLVVLVGQWAGAPGGLDVLGSSLSVRGLAVDAYAFGTDGLPSSVNIESAPSPTNSGTITGHVDQYHIDAAASGRLLAQVDVHGLVVRFSLIDSHGTVLVQSDGQGPGNLDALIDQHVPAGTYVLAVTIEAGVGTYELAASFAPISTAFEAGQNLKPSPLYPTNSPISLLIGDFNGDGIPDVVMFDGVHPGVGDGTFRSPLSGLDLPSGDYYGPMVEGDFNGDGKLDIAVADYSNSMVLVVMGNGDGTFQTGKIYAVGEFPFSFAYHARLVTGDFNGDGKVDLALDAGFRSTVYVLLGNGDGTFQPPAAYKLPYFSAPDSIVVGDFNGDGVPDLAVADTGGAIDVLLGRGDGTFGAGVYRQALVSSAELGINSLVAGDFNGDGKLDLAASSSDYASIEILLGNGDGTFQRPVDDPVPLKPAALHVGDFNGDGKLDVLFWGGGAFSSDPFI